MSNFGGSNTLYGQVRASVVENNVYDDTLKAIRQSEIPSNLQMRVAYNADGTTLYTGFAERSTASSATGWLLQKFTYTANKQVDLRQIAYDSWDNRTTATYA